MIPFVIVDKNGLYKETIAAEDILQALNYCDKKYDDTHELRNVSMIKDIKGNLVYVFVDNVVKDEYRIK